ncbi:MAG: hypothetical protein ABJ246_08715 [Paracoccaceae bacterium]
MSKRLTTGIELGEYASSILRQAQSFDRDLIWEERDPVERHHSGVEQMLLAFAMELALKAWYVFDHDREDFKRTHNLLKLFDALKFESQDRLEQEFKKTVAHYHSNGIYIDFGIRDVLRQHADAFIDWRYLHERKKRGMSFHTGTFIATLEMILRVFRTRYRTVRIEPTMPYR